jgi:hypothetical protein
MRTVPHAEHTVVDHPPHVLAPLPAQASNVSVGFILPLPPPQRCLDMGRQLLLLAVVAALGEALTCLPEFLDFDFPEVGTATTGLTATTMMTTTMTMTLMRWCQLPPVRCHFFPVPPSPSLSVVHLLPLFNLLVLASSLTLSGNFRQSTFLPYSITA